MVADDRTIAREDINVALVRRLVAAQFPQWADLPIRPVAFDGWDNRTFHLGADMSVRLPSAQGYIAQVDKEHRRLRTLADAYDAGADEPLTPAERAALPVALARTPLAFIAMIAAVDSEGGARRLAAEMTTDIAWALVIMHDLARRQAAFA